jgi:glycosyltransferase involved in cell wall biosynthesis
VATPVPNAPKEFYGATVWKTSGFPLPLNEFCHTEYLDIWESKALINKINPDIVQVCAPTWIQWGALYWCRLYNIPIILSYHTHVPEYIKHYGLGILGDFLSWFFWVLVRNGQNWSNLTVVTSQAMGDELKENGIVNEIKVWRRGVDTETYHPCKASKEMRRKLMPNSEKELLLLYVGRISAEKNLSFLAAVLSDSRLKGRVHLSLIGDGPIRKQLETETFAELKDCVSFMGFMQGEELASAYASSDVFIFPSETETLGLVAIEAMANGLPVIGVNARGIAITVKNEETGLLYDSGDVDKCVEHVLRMLDHPEDRIRLSKNARADAEQWGWDKATLQIVGVYNELILNRSLQAQAARGEL